MKKKNSTKKKKKRRALNYQRILFIICIFAGLFYCGTKIGLSAYNIALSTQDQALSEKVTKQEKKVEQLTADINSLQDKSRVMGILDNDVADNQKNVYIIE